MFTLLTAEWIDYLKIQQSEEEGFVYYGLIELYSEHWNVIGVRVIRDDPLLLDVRLLYIDQDARDWENFVAETHAPGMMLVNPVDYRDSIIFLESLLSKRVVLEDSNQLKYYKKLTEQEMAIYHYPLQSEELGNDCWYLYLPPTEIKRQNEESIVRFPQWISHIGKNQVVGFWFLTVSQKQLDDPQFNLIVDSEGLGTIQFDEHSLLELIILLKRYAFEND